jgi:hypothetical protein
MPRPSKYLIESSGPHSFELRDLDSGLFQTVGRANIRVRLSEDDVPNPRLRDLLRALEAGKGRGVQRSASCPQACRHNGYHLSVYGRAPTHGAFNPKELFQIDAARGAAPRRDLCRRFVEWFSARRA